MSVCLMLIVMLFHGTVLPYVKYLVIPDTNIHLSYEIVGFRGVHVAGLSSRGFVSWCLEGCTSLCFT